MELFEQLFGQAKAPTQHSVVGAAKTVKASIPYALLAAEGYTNPSRLISRLTTPQKTKLLKDIGLLSKMVSKGKATSTIRMAWKKRGKGKRRAPKKGTRKRSYKKRKTPKRNNLLSSIHKALAHRM